MKDYYKFKPTKITNIIYYCLLLLGILPMIIRWISAFNSHVIFINEEINSHISNFSLSLLVYLGIGFTWVLHGVALKKCFLLGLIIVVANILCETVMGFMNTTDIWDAIYGIAGTLISFCYLSVIKRYGLEIINDKN